MPTAKEIENLNFLPRDEKLFFEALCDAIVPAGSDPKVEPGALTVGGLTYIDSNLYGLPKETQHYFKQTIDLLNQKCRKRFSPSRNFAELNPSEREIILKEFYQDPTTRERMFDLRSLVLEAFYSDYHDPTYDGITAWEYLQFGGRRITELKKDWTFLKVWKDYQEKERIEESK
jgi:Gluconate 2-dehydrogenase subunit 3